MFTFGLVVEGNDDEAAIPELIRRIREDECEIIVRRARNAPQLMKNMGSLLRTFKHAKQGGPVDKAIVIRDADRKDPRVLVRGLKNRITRDVLSLFTVRTCVIVNALEAWLLVDEGAISRACEQRSGHRVQPVHEDIEKILHPKERLFQLLGKVVYTSQVAREIAQHADLERIKTRCPTFLKFEQAVLDC